jgi:alanyl-tRNA synthetase
MLAQQRLLDRVSRDLRTTWHEVPEAIAQLQERTRATEREMAALRGKLAGSLVDELLHSASDVAGVPMIAQRVAVGERGDLRQLADRLRDRQQSGVVVLGAVFDDKPALLAMVSPDLVSRGLKAGDIIREIAQYVEGRGGGRPDLAEAGGKNAAGLDEALLAVSGAIEAALEPST